MAIFQNQATITYGGVTRTSNVVTGEYTEALTMTKTPVVDTYAAGGTVTYLVSLVNSGANALEGIVLTDDLGGYAVTGGTAYPLTYEADSLVYTVNGVVQTAPTVNAGPPMTVGPISVPAGGNALVAYRVQINDYAPLAAGSTIVNTVTAAGGGAVEQITASATVTVVEAADLSITKGISPAVVGQDGAVTYTFRIENLGNAPIGEADDLVLTDAFAPVLSDISVTMNGAPLPAEDYDYSGGVFATVAGAVTVPAATYETDPATGLVSVTPGVTLLTVSGTI